MKCTHPTMVLLLFYALVFTVANVMNLPVHFKRQYGIAVKANERKRDLHTLFPSDFDDVFLLIKLFPSYHFTDYKVFIVSVSIISNEIGKIFATVRPRMNVD